MDNSQYNIFTLPGGLRCVHRRTDSHVSYIGLVINAGSSDDPAGKEGLAHFVEHTVFKGTRHRSSWHVSNRMESVGGELNAYTSKEETVIYTNAPAGDPARALELLSDLVAYADFPSAEVEREREVVIEEIKSYLDSPGDSVFDRYEDLLYAGSGLGHNILGSEESVRSLCSADCRGFIDDLYVPSRMSLYVSDPSSFSRIEALANRYFGFLDHEDASEARRLPVVNPVFDKVIDDGGHQAHTIVGARTFGRDDSRRFALFLLNNHLAGPCMNSRLNQELRERRGLVYTVDSSVALMGLSGSMMIYFGSDRTNVSKCRRLIARELEKLAESPIKPKIFEQIKRQYRGQLLVSSDHRESAAMALGKSLLYYGELHDAAWSASRVSEVTTEEVRAVAELVAPSLCSTLTLC